MTRPTIHQKGKQYVDRSLKNVSLNNSWHVYKLAAGTDLTICQTISRKIRINRETTADKPNQILPGDRKSVNEKTHCRLFMQKVTQPF